MGRHDCICPVCGKGFSDDIQLSIHRKLKGHTGRTPKP
jgi:hypothetical protein